MQKKKIRIQFTDQAPGFKAEDSLWMEILSTHFLVEISPQPDYLIYSVFGQDHLRYNCIKIFWTGENQVPDFNLCDYAIGFQYLSLGDRYLRLPNYFFYHKSLFDLLEQKVHVQKSDLKKKTHFCSFVYSNNHASPERQVFFNLLAEYKAISSGGRFLNNIGRAIEDKWEFQSQHKFAIAFENASSPGYTTEKLPQALSAQTVAIYWGDPLVGKQFNTKGFINCHQYSSFAEVVEQVKYLDQNDEAYLAMLQQPVFEEGGGYTENRKALDDFLVGIFSQNIEQAQRYNREYWGRKYLNKQREIWSAYNRSLKGIAERYYMRFFRTIEKNNKSVLLWKLHKGLMKLLKKN